MPKKNDTNVVVECLYDEARDTMVSIISSNNTSTISSRDKICILLQKTIEEYKIKYTNAGFEPEQSIYSSKLALEGAFSMHARQQAENGEYKNMDGLLDLVLQAATSEICESKAPFVMLEDLFEASTLDKCKSLWELIEERRDIICNPKFVPDDIKRNTKSKLALLRIANSLLRRLSLLNKDTEFCGRIVMFLAYVYPLSERSGVNLKGEVNTSNTTDFEEEVDFDVEDEHGGEEQIDSRATDDDEQQTTIDYNLYRQFWDVQRYSSNPHLAYHDLNHWKEFRLNVDTMLGAFEGHALSNDATNENPSILSPSSTSSSSSSSSSSCSSEFNPKFLTNSRLLRLQLRDPELRRTFLCQLLIVCDRLTHKKVVNELPAAFKGENWLPVTFKHYISWFLTPPLPPLLLTTAVQSFEYLTNVRSRSIQLLATTPPNGSDFVDGVLHVLSRERSLWTKWKEDKCPVYEKFADDNQMEEDKAGRIEVVTSIVKTRRALAKSGGHSKNSTRGKRQAANASVKQSTSLLWESQGVTNTERLKMASKNARTVADALKEYRERVEEAEDPENDIEEQYHPKNEADFSWKCLRSLSQVHLDLFEFIEKTDDEKAGSVKTALQKLRDKENGLELKNIRPAAPKSVSGSGSGSSSSGSSSSSSNGGGGGGGGGGAKGNKSGKRKRDNDNDDDVEEEDTNAKKKLKEDNTNTKKAKQQALNKKQKSLAESIKKRKKG
jgi:THO complex subunit 1